MPDFFDQYVAPLAQKKPTGDFFDQYVAPRIEAPQPEARGEFLQQEVLAPMASIGTPEPEVPLMPAESEAVLQQAPWGVDAPTPQNPAEAQRAWMKQNVMLTPNGDAQTEMLDMADKLALDEMTALGLRDETGFVLGSGELFKELRGAYYYQLAGGYGEFKPEEVSQVGKEAIRRIADVTMRGLDARLAADPTNQELIEDRAQIQEMASLAGDPSTQGYFFQMMRTASDNNWRRATFQGNESERERAMLESRLLDTAFDAPLEQSVTSQPRMARYHRVLSKHFRLFDEADSYERLMTSAFRGSLMQVRLERFGIPPETDATVLSMQGIKAFTHPGLAARLADKSRLVQAVRLGKPVVDSALRLPSDADSPAVQKATEEEERARFSDVAQLLIEAAAPGPLLELEGVVEQLKMVHGPDAESKVKNITQEMGKLFSVAGWSAKGAAQALGSAGGWWSDLFGVRETEPSQALATAQAMRETQSRLQDALDQSGKIAGYHLRPNVDLLLKLPGGGMDFDAFRKTMPESVQRATERSEMAHRAYMGDPDASILDLGYALWGQVPEGFAATKGGWGMRPETIQRLYEKGRDGQLTAFWEHMALDGFSPEQEQQAREQTAATYLRYSRGEETLGTTLQAVGSYTVYRMGVAFRGAVDAFLRDPVATAGVLASTAAVAGGASAGVVGPVKQFIRTAVQGARLRQLLPAALKANPEAVLALGRSMRQRAPGGSPATAEALQAGIDALDHLSSYSRTRLGPDGQPQMIRGWLARGVDSAVERVVEATRYLTPDGISDVMGAMRFDDAMKHWVQKPGALRTLASGALNRLGIRAGGRVVKPWAKEAEGAVMSRIHEAPETPLEDFPISIDALTPRAEGFWGRVMPSKREVPTKSNLQAMAEYVGGFQERVVAVRARQAQNYAHLDAYLDYRIRRELNRAHEARIGEALNFEEARATRVDAINRAGRLRTIRQRSDKFFDLDERDEGFAASRALEPEFTELTTFLHARQIPGREVLEALRRPREEIADTAVRYAEAVAQPNGIPARNMARQLAREYLDLPGIKDGMLFDLDDGVTVLTKRAADRLAADHADGLPPGALLDEEPAVFTDTDIGTFWADVRRRAKAELAGKPYSSKVGLHALGDRMESNWALNDGRIDTMRRAAANQGTNVRLAMLASEKKSKRFHQAYEDLEPDARAAFDAAHVAYRDHGIDGDLQTLRADPRLKHLWAALSPKSPDDAVSALLDSVVDFRKRVLLETAPGVRGGAELAKLLGPYSPRLHSIWETPRVIGDSGGRLWDEPVAALDGSVSHGELEAGRDPAKYKAQVYVRGGRVVERLFDSEGEARSWLTQTWGAGKLAPEPGKLGGNSWVGKTTTQDPVAILSPLGPEAQALLGQLESGAGIFNRMQQLYSNALKVKYFNGWDRPGVAFDAAQWANFIRSPEGDVLKRHFEKLPVNHTWGSLSGKYVHKRILRELNEYGEGGLILNSLHKWLSDMSRSEDWIARSLAGGAKLTLGAAGIAKDLISTAQIVYSRKVVLANALSEFFFFGPAATDSGIVTSWRGMQASGEAASTLLKLGHGKYDALHEDIRYGLENGALDDTMIGALGSKSYDATKLTAIFGGRRNAIKTFLAPWTDPRIRKASKREDFLTRILSSPDADTMPPELVKQMVVEREHLRTVTKSHLPKAIAVTGDLFQSLVSNVFLGRKAGRFRDIENPFRALYQFIGNWSRLRAYIYQLKKGVPREIALANVNDFMQTYSNVPKALQSLSRTPVGSSVVSFPFEALRISGNLMRKRPSFMAGFMGSMASANLMAMAANGVDPNDFFDTLRADYGSAMRGMTSGLMLPGIEAPTHVEMQFLSPANWMIAPALGAAAGFFDDPDNADPSLLGGAVRTAGSVARSFIGGNPVANVVASTMFRRDFMTGKQYRTTGEATDSAVDGILHLAVPHWMPYLGADARNLNRVIDQGPAFYSGRTRGAFKQALQSNLPVRMQRGDILPILDRMDPTRRHLATALAMKATKMHAAVVGVDLPDDPRIILGRGGEFNERDMLALTIHGTKGAERGGEVAERYYDTEFSQIQFAVSVLADETSSPEERKRAIEMRDSALDSLEKKRARPALMGDPRMFKRMTPGEQLGLVRAQLQGQDLTVVMDNMGLLRRTEIIARMQESPIVSDQLMNLLLAQYTMSLSTGQLRKPTDLGEIAQSLEVIGHFASTPRGRPRERYLAGMAMTLLNSIPNAAVRFARTAAFEAKTRRALQILHAQE